MAGAIAGSAILDARSTDGVLDTVTLTVNNSCNLSCPHCYLQYDGARGLIAPSTIRRVHSAHYRHLAIVGKEPLVDHRSAAITSQIIDTADSLGRTVSVITNGLGIQRLNPRSLEKLSYLDVSFDAGPAHYADYRGGRFSRVLEGIEYARSSGVKRVRALGVVNSRTINYLDDLSEVLRLADCEWLILSPYLMTRNNGRNLVERVEVSVLLERLCASRSFMDTPRSILLLDSHHLGQGRTSIGQARQLACALGMDHKVLWIDNDPLSQGFIRVTYDGLALTPYDSTDVADYGERGIRLESDEWGESGLDVIYTALLSSTESCRN